MGPLGLPRVYWVLWVGQFVNRLGSFVLTFLPLFLTERHGYTEAEAGRVLALYGAGNLLGASLGGWSSDRFGRRRTLLALLALNALVLVGFGFAPRGPLVALAAVLHGVSNGYGPALSAAVADVVSPDDRQRAFGYFYWAVNLGFTVAASLGGALSRRGYHWLFLGDAATSLALALIVYRAVPETRPAEAAAARTPLSGALRPFADPRFTGFALAQLCALVAFVQAFVTMPLHERTQGVPVERIGAIAALNGVVIVVAQPVFSRLARGASSGALLTASSLLLSAGALVAARAEAAAGFAACMAVVSLAEVVFAGAAPTFVARVSPAALRGSYQGAYSLCWAAAGMLAPLLGPWALRRHGAHAMWTAAALVALVAAALHATLTRRAEAVAQG